MDFAPYHRYPIHDNGGRPFLVELCQDEAIPRPGHEHEHQVKVFGGKSHPRPGEVLLTLDSLGTHVAQGETDSTPGGGLKVAPEVAGNTILVCVGEDLRRPSPGVVRVFTYVWVGPEVVQFKTDEPVYQFRSPLGNNDVPYAFVQTKSWTYLLTEGVRVPRRVVEGSREAWGSDPSPYGTYYRERGGGERVVFEVLVPRVGAA